MTWETSAPEPRPRNMSPSREAKLRHTVHRNGVALSRLQAKRARIERRLAANVPGICFGTRKLFAQQHQLALAGFRDRDAWLRAWQESRWHQVYFVGSKDETAGNQLCQLRQTADGHYQLKVRVPDCLRNRGVTETDPSGNLKSTQRFALLREDATSGQREAVLSDALSDDVAWAKDEPKPIVAEDLDFTAKKKAMAQLSPKGARMLSGLLYARYRQLLEAKCFRAGAELILIDAAYTSTIGAVKYAARRGWSVHAERLAAPECSTTGDGGNAVPLSRGYRYPCDSNLRVQICAPLS
jgi:IS605 OrfB family transposase